MQLPFMSTGRNRDSTTFRYSMASLETWPVSVFTLLGLKQFRDLLQCRFLLPTSVKKWSSARSQPKAPCRPRKDFSLENSQENLWRMLTQMQIFTDNENLFYEPVLRYRNYDSPHATLLYGVYQAHCSITCGASLIRTNEDFLRVRFSKDDGGGGHLFSVQFLRGL